MKDNYSWLDSLKEQLASIEHERWSDWQNYVHKVYLEGNFKEFMLRWQKQIATPYAELSREEQLSDLEQVDRYLPLIELYCHKQVIELVRELLPEKKYYGEENGKPTVLNSASKLAGYNECIQHILTRLDKLGGKL